MGYDTVVYQGSFQGRAVIAVKRLLQDFVTLAMILLLLEVLVTPPARRRQPQQCKLV